RGTAASAPAALPIAAHHLVLSSTELEQALGGALLGDHCRRQGLDPGVVGRIRQLLQGVFSEADGLVARGLRPLAGEAGLRPGRPLEDRLPRLLDRLAGLGEWGGGLRTELATDQVPGGVDDLLRELGQPGGLLAVLAFLAAAPARATGGLLALAEDLLEVT